MPFWQPQIDPESTIDMLDDLTIDQQLDALESILGACQRKPLPTNNLRQPYPCHRTSVQMSSKFPYPLARGGGAARAVYQELYGKI